MSPDRLSPDQLKSIGEKLRQRGVPARCPVCNRADMRLMPALGAISLPGWDSPEYPIGPGNLPCAVRICENCGFVLLHAMDMLEVGDPPDVRTNGKGSS